MKIPIQIWIGRKCFRKIYHKTQEFFEEPKGITFGSLDFLSKAKMIPKSKHLYRFNSHIENFKNF